MEDRGWNTKLLIGLSFGILLVGFSFLWFGLKSAAQIQTSPSPTLSPIAQESPIATSSSVVGIEGEKVLVTKVVDGDTIDLENGQTVRFIGIDTP